MAGKGGGGKGEADGRRSIVRNRRARFDYDVLDVLEAGIELRGPEVKSLRAGLASLADSYAAPRRGEIFLFHLHISPYPQAGRENPDPRRERRLLLHKREIAKLEGQLGDPGTTLVPLSLYFRDGLCKVELALARGRKKGDKRAAIREREGAREVQRALRKGRRGPAA
jgi:SsrA-binding protein